MIYRPAKGSILSEEQAQRYGERLYDLAEENNGILTPESVADDAVKPGSPLHDFFEWNDVAAAIRWRKEQASYLLRSVHVVLVDDDGNEHVMRFTHNVRILDEDTEEPTRVYTTIQRVLTDAEIKKQVVEQAWNQLQSWQRLYHEYSEFSAVFQAIGTVEQSLEQD